VSKTHRLALLNVGASRKRALGELQLNIAIVKDPIGSESGKPGDPSHALIEQVDEALRLALGTVLSNCVIDVVSAK